MVTNVQNKIYRRKKHETNQKIQYLDPFKLKLFIEPKIPFFFPKKRDLELKSESFGKISTASLLVRWLANSDSYFIENVATARSSSGHEPVTKSVWVRGKQLEKLQQSDEGVVLMLWELFRRPNASRFNVKISHIPTYRVIREWHESGDLPQFQIRNSCQEKINSFLS